MTDIIKAIKDLKSDAQVTVDNDDINKITWHDGNPTNITNKQITDKQTELQTEYDNKKYQRDRKAEYPTIEECVHAILDDTLDDLQAKRQAVKEKYPK
tara:strand:- start:671 stop:964 length:294 start_codon:yes stop_codon:yes gene_type:complete